MNNLVTLDNANGVNQYHIDVAAVAVDGFSDWYEEAVFFNAERGCTFSFYRDGALVAFTQY